MLRDAATVTAYRAILERFGDSITREGWLDRLARTVRGEPLPPPGRPDLESHPPPRVIDELQPQRLISQNAKSSGASRARVLNECLQSSDLGSVRVEQLQRGQETSHKLCVAERCDLARPSRRIFGLACASSGRFRIEHTHERAGGYVQKNGSTLPRRPCSVTEVRGLYGFSDEVHRRVWRADSRRRMAAPLRRRGEAARGRASNYLGRPRE